MIIKDIRTEFFDSLRGRILILCAFDVDAICACKILQSLLENYNLEYSVAPVGSIENLVRSFEDYRDTVNSVITINFGNSINLPRLLSPPKNLTFYIIDSHRPINVFNYYKNRNVCLYINRHEQELNIPSRNKIFFKNQTGIVDPEHDEDKMALLNADPRSLTSEQLEERQELRDWLLKRKQILYDYEEFQYYNRSVALIMYDLASDLSKDNNYLLWMAIVGLTYQIQSDKIDRDFFEKEAETLIRHIARHKISTNQYWGYGWVIEWKLDLQVDLYTKWSLYDSLHYSPKSVCKFQLWNDKGQRNLLEFLVQCGLKLIECKRLYPAMDRDIRNNLVSDVYRVCTGDGVQYDYEDLVAKSFVLRKGFKHQFSATDIVHAVRAFLDAPSENFAIIERFANAIQSLSMQDFTIFNDGFEIATRHLMSMFSKVKDLITTMKIVDLGSFLHVDLDMDENTKYFCRGDSLMDFARFLLSAYVASKSTRLARRAVRLPLILFMPDHDFPDRFFIVGIQPVLQTSKKNFFAKAFEQAALNADCEISIDLSETNLAKADLNHKNKLLDQLKALLE